MTPHVHAIMLVHPDVHKRFKSAIPLFAPTFTKLPPVNMSLDIKLLPTCDDLKNATFYSAVMLRSSNPEFQDVDLYTVLPKSKDEPIYSNRKD